MEDTERYKTQESNSNSCLEEQKSSGRLHENIFPINFNSLLLSQCTKNWAKNIVRSPPLRIYGAMRMGELLTKGEKAKKCVQKREEKK